MTLPKTLVNATREGSLVPLVGSGLSTAAGMASWDRVVDALRAQFPPADSPPGVDFDTLETPDAVRRYIPKSVFVQVVEEAYGGGYEPTPQHHLLATLPLRTVLTTNFDSLIERSLIAANHRVSVIAQESEVRNWRESHGVQVVKFHGTVERPDTLVFGERAYAELYQSNGLMMSLLRTIVATRPILFLGFGMRDPFVKSLLQSVHHATTRGIDRDHYILVRGEDARSRYYEDLGLMPIVVPGSGNDPYGVTAFLTQLSAEAALEAMDRVSRTALLVRETERLADYLGPERQLRVRAALGPLTVPTDSADAVDLFGDANVFAMEGKLRDVTVRFLEAGGRLTLICNPVHNLDHALSKGYSAEAYRLRIATMLSFLERYPRQIRIGMMSRASDANEWIAADKALIVSSKGTTADARLYSYGRVELASGLIRQAIRRFDSDFLSIRDAYGSDEASTQAFIREARKVTISPPMGAS